jgi:hypothetical protein
MCRVCHLFRLAVLLDGQILGGSGVVRRGSPWLGLRGLPEEIAPSIARSYPWSTSLRRSDQRESAAGLKRRTPWLGLEDYVSRKKRL